MPVKQHPVKKNNVYTVSLDVNGDLSSGVAGPYKSPSEALEYDPATSDGGMYANHTDQLRIVLWIDDLPRVEYVWKYGAWHRAYENS